MTKQGRQMHKGPGPWLLIGLLSGFSAFASTAIAAETVDGDIDGDLRANSLCIVPNGDNCATVANDPEIRLEADTVRMRFLDTTAGNTREDGKLGDSWSLLANDYSGAGDKAQDYFGFTLRSVDPTPDESGNDIVGKHVFRLGPSDSASGSAGAVAIGLDSDFVEGTVSLGNALVQRRLAHVAAAMQETDALIKRQLEEGLLGSVGDIADRLDALEAEVVALETQLGIGAGSGGGGSGDGGGSSGGGGGGGLMGIPTLVFLAGLLGVAWRRHHVVA